MNKKAWEDIQVVVAGITVLAIAYMLGGFFGIALLLAYCFIISVALEFPPPH